ncbi:MAG: hypothetical protein AABY83_06660 [Pseudomonadota bacterium]
MRTLSKIFATILSLFGMQVIAAEGDKLLIEVIQQEPPNTVQGLPRPVSGMTPQEVREAFGDPSSSIGPVGKPAITRWEYEQFVVIFEDHRVLRSIPKFKPGFPPNSVATQE